MMTSAMHCLSRSRATLPFSASINNHAWGSSQERMRSRCIASSSTTKIRVGPEGALYFAIRSTNFSRSIGFVRYPTAPSVMPCRARVNHRDLKKLPPLMQGRRDLQLDVTRLSKLAGIAQEIPNNLPQPHRIGFDRWKIRWAFDG